MAGARQFDEPRRPCTILVADDDPGVLRVLVRILKNEGYHVIQGVDGADAIAALDAAGGPLDLLVTDVRMPRMDGCQLAAALRQRDPDLRVLYLTGYSDALFDKAPLLPDRTAYLDKPASSQAIREAVGLLVRAALDAGAREPEFSPLPILVETEFLRMTLKSGRTARILVAGEPPSATDLEDVLVKIGEAKTAIAARRLR